LAAASAQVIERSASETPAPEAPADQDVLAGQFGAHRPVVVRADGQPAVGRLLGPPRRELGRG